MVQDLESVVQQTPTIHIGPVSIHFIDQNGGQFVARGKWRAFYLLLITSKGTPVDRLSVSHLKGWSGDVVAVGREIARHLSSSRISRLKPSPVLSERPTLEWVLDPGWKVTDLRASNTNLDGELALLFRNTSPDNALGVDHASQISEILRICEAQLLFYEGRLAEATKLALALRQETLSADLKAIAGLIALRAGWRLPGERESQLRLAKVEADIMAQTKSEVVLHVQERLRIVRALHTAPAEWAEMAQSLARVARQVSRGLDVAQAAYGENYSALIRRRLGQPAESQALIQRALLHAAASGDVYLMQIVAFNLGLIFSEAAPEGGGEASEIALAALRFVHRIARDHRIGNDSAQHELLMADICLRKGDIEQARAEIDSARQLVGVSGSVYDQAELHRLEAGLLMAERREAVAQDVRQLLQKSMTLYEQAQRSDLAAKVKAELDRIR